MRCSVLDLGSNSFHVLVADLDGHTLVPVEREREMLHLGRAVATHDGRLPEDDLRRAERTVAHLSALARRSGSTAHHAVATAALRDATNGPEAIARLSEAADAPVQVLAGGDEAAAAYRGVRAGVAVDDEPVLVVDLGGGSLQLAVGAGAAVTSATSVPLGASRRSPVLASDPPTCAEVDALVALVDDHLAPHVDRLRGSTAATAVAVGGAVRALARVAAAARGSWLPTSLNQVRVGRDELAGLRDRLLAVDVADRAGLPGMKSRRADHLHAAAVILHRTFELLEVDEVVVSDWGMREGVLLDRHGDAAPPQAPAALRRAEVARLRATFPGDRRHLAHLAALATELFDRLRDVHGLDDGDRELLELAAWLHDLGEAVALRRHPEHGAYLLTHAELRGFDPEQLGVLATLVRHHRSRGIGRGSEPYASLTADSRRRAQRLLPLLQIADRCDRTGDRRTLGVTVVRDHDGVTVEPVGAPLAVAPLELERTERLFAAAYGVPLRFAAGVATHPDRSPATREGPVPDDPPPDPQRRAAGRRLAAAATHRVGPGDVRSRVSVRSRLPDGTATDVVGRLVAADDAALVVVDRHTQLHVLDPARVVASKVVPEHPRRPAEPVDLGTRDRPIPREAARLLVVDGDGRVLLAGHQPAPDRTVWTAPGGGLRPGEEHRDAAAREAVEELGVAVDLGPWVWSRQVTFAFAGVWLDQRERWFLVRLDRFDVAAAPLDDVGLADLRWWTVTELRDTDAQLAPGSLPDHLDALLRDGPPQQPVDVGR